MMNLSRRGFVTGAGALAAAAVATTAHANPNKGPNQNKGPGNNNQSVTGYVRSTIARMTLEQKVGQLFVQELYGTHPDEDSADNLRIYGYSKASDVVRNLHLGGAIYFAWTHSYAGGPTGVARLSNGLQQAALEIPRGNKVSVPLIIATDQEQGLVSRFGPPATQFPGAMALGAGRSAADARESAAITGEELRAVGINTNFAPVADVNVDPANPVIGIRSFSSDPGLVAEMVAAQVAGYQDDAKVSASAKHFPGHGDTGVDSHYGLPEITHTLEEWRELDLPPFQAAIEQGIDMIMTAHLVMPALDPTPGLPATLSKPILTDILRRELGYRGVIITDALNMAGVREQYSDEEIAVRALEAGVDMLLMSPSPIAVRNAVLDAVHSGRLSEKFLEEKIERVLRMKFNRGITKMPTVDVGAVGGIVGAPEHLEVADEVTERTITLVRDDGLLPVDVSSKSVLVTGWGASTTQMVADALTRAGASVQRFETGTAPTAATRASVVAAARSVSLTVVLTMNVGVGSAQAALVNELEGAGVDMVAVAVRNPYDVARYDAGNALCTYSYTLPVMPKALVRVITGEVNPQGKLPVDVPTADGTGVAYPFGHGLSY